MNVPTVKQLTAEFIELGIIHPVEPMPASYGRLMSILYEQNAANGFGYDAEGFTSAEDYRNLLDTILLATGGALEFKSITLTEEPAPIRSGYAESIMTFSAIVGGKLKTFQWVDGGDWVSVDFREFVDELVAETTPGGLLDIPTWDQTVTMIYVPDRRIVERVKELLHGIYYRVWNPDDEDGDAVLPE